MKGYICDFYAYEGLNTIKNIRKELAILGYSCKFLTRKNQGYFYLNLNIKGYLISKTDISFTENIVLRTYLLGKGFYLIAHISENYVVTVVKNHSNYVYQKVLEGEIISVSEQNLLVRNLLNMFLISKVISCGSLFVSAKTIQTVIRKNGNN